MKKNILVFSLVFSCLFFYSCATVQKSQVVGDWNLYNYESPDPGLSAYMNRNKETIQYVFTDSMAYFQIDGQSMYVNYWELDNRMLSLTSEGNGNPTDWKITKVDDNHLVLKATNNSIGKRVYTFRR